MGHRPNVGAIARGGGQPPPTPAGTLGAATHATVRSTRPTMPRRRELLFARGGCGCLLRCRREPRRATGRSLPDRHGGGSCRARPRASGRPGRGRSGRPGDPPRGGPDRHSRRRRSPAWLPRPARSGSPSTRRWPTCARRWTGPRGAAGGVAAGDRPRSRRPRWAERRSPCWERPTTPGRRRCGEVPRWAMTALAAGSARAAARAAFGARATRPVVRQLASTLAWRERRRCDAPSAWPPSGWPWPDARPSSRIRSSGSSAPVERGRARPGPVRRPARRLHPGGRLPRPPTGRARAPRRGGVEGTRAAVGGGQGVARCGLAAAGPPALAGWPSWPIGAGPWSSPIPGPDPAPVASPAAGRRPRRWGGSSGSPRSDGAGSVGPADRRPRTDQALDAGRPDPGRARRVGAGEQGGLFAPPTDLAVAASTAVPASPRLALLDGWEAEGLRFTRPRTCGDLERWGRMLRCCVGTYGPAAVAGLGELLAVSRGTEVRACLEARADRHHPPAAGSGEPRRRRTPARRIVVRALVGAGRDRPRHHRGTGPGSAHRPEPSTARSWPGAAATARLRACRPGGGGRPGARGRRR